jgi:hypothetical protein
VSSGRYRLLPYIAAPFARDSTGQHAELAHHAYPVELGSNVGNSAVFQL